MTKQVKQLIFWIGALVIGAVLGSLHMDAINSVCDFVATVFTRLFKFIAVPAIAVSVLTTLATLGSNKETARIFRRTNLYKLNPLLYISLKQYSFSSLDFITALLLADNRYSFFG